MAPLSPLAHAGPFQRVDGDVDRLAIAGTDLLADIEHRRLVHFTFADDHGAVDLDRLQAAAHRLGGGPVRGIFITHADPAPAG